MKWDLMSGIVFFKTTMLDEIVEFYTSKLKMEIWLEQDGCTILKYDNLLLGFCQREEAETQGMITLFFEQRVTVDLAYAVHKEIATGPPKENEKYKIYQFFAKDPEGRDLEFQHFLHPLKPI